MLTPFWTESCSWCGIQLLCSQVAKIDTSNCGACFSESWQGFPIKLRGGTGDLERRRRRLSSFSSPQTTKTAEFPSKREFSLSLCGACLNDKHLLCPIRNHMFSKILPCFYFEIFICISKKIFRQPSMVLFVSWSSRKNKTKQNKASIYYPE